jgi:hypothetical protein
VSSLTTRQAVLFNLPGDIVVNQVTLGIGTITTAGTLKICVYTADGATKKIDVTTATVSGAVLNTAVSAVELVPGQYYAVVGCATTCSDAIIGTAADSTGTAFGAGTPSGKKVYQGTVSHTSGTCNSSLGTVTGSNPVIPVFRFDN